MDSTKRKVVIDMIDNVWKLEGFVNQKNARAAIKYGFIGLGQGGSKIADAFAGIMDKAGNQTYKVLIVNSNLGDMAKIKNIPQSNRLPLIGYENGVGKDPDLGRRAFQENGYKVFEAIQNMMMDRDIIYVNVSMGGGTGTGSVNELVDAIADHLHIPVGVIATLPRPNEVESLNAYNATSELVKKLGEIRYTEDGEAYRALENLIILDNEKIVTEHSSHEAEVKGLTWDFYSNYKIAAIMHEVSVLTSLESDFTVDAADLMKHVIRQGSLMTFAKKKIDLEEVTTKEDLINEVISTYKGKNVLANGFDYENDLKSMALVVVMPKKYEDRLNHDTLEEIRTRMKTELPDVSFYPGSVSWSSERFALVYTMASMAGLPERAKLLRQEAEELRNKREERERKASGFDMGEKLETTSTATTAARRKTPGANPFAAFAAPSGAEPAKKEVPSKKVNPFEDAAFIKNRNNK